LRRVSASDIYSWNTGLSAPRPPRNRGFTYRVYTGVKIRIANKEIGTLLKKTFLLYRVGSEPPVSDEIICIHSMRRVQVSS
jgi:hypothetical protein